MRDRLIDTFWFDLVFVVSVPPMLALVARAVVLQLRISNQS